MSKTIETNLFKIHYSDSLYELVTATVDLLQKKIGEYQEFFGMKFDETFTVNYFDDLEEFREFIYNIRGEKESLPSYAKGTYDEGMINAYIERETQLKRLYTASHELFHILYMKKILNNDYSKRIVWYDEGMAQFMSGEKDQYIDEESFKRFYLKVKQETKMIPNLNELEHGKSFYNDQYNAYDLSYLAIRYLHEQLSPLEFQKLMSNFSVVKKYGENILMDIFHYYDERFQLYTKKDSY